MFLALYEVIECAGLHLHTDRPERDENAPTWVRHDWRGHGVASHPKLRTLQGTAANGLRGALHLEAGRELTDAGPSEHLSYVTTRTSITRSRALPLAT
jgi:hypothetical protein